MTATPASGPRRGAALLAVLLLAAAPVPLSGRAADAAPAEAVRWRPCDEVVEGIPVDPEIADCALHRVPRDHGDPGGATVDLVMLRRKAADREDRKGALFVNPGGPGASGLHTAYRAERFIGADAAARYDVIGFDPRGVGQSEAMQCFASQEEADKALKGRVAVPVGRAEVGAALRAERAYTDACERRGGPMMRHMGTLDVARDLDLMRRGVGEPRLDFLGLSYGSMIGATYANLYPARVGAMVLDGGIDPGLRMSDGTEYDRQRAVGAEDGLDAFLDACAAAGERCAFGAGDPGGAFAALRTRLREGPIALPDGTEVRLSGFTGQVYQALSDGDLTGLAESLAALDDAAADPGGATAGGTEAARRFAVPDAGPGAAPGGGSGSGGGEGASPYRGNDAADGVNCADKPYRGSAAQWPVRARQWERRAPTFGRMQAFEAVPCSTWPVRAHEADRYTGPWDRPLPRPVLVVGNLHDPVTSYAFAERLAGALGDSRLLTVDRIGHTALGQNGCARAHAGRYLLNGALPGTGAVCDADEPPFPGG